MMYFVVLLMATTVMCEPMVYMFPTNPSLHPSQMYPNQQFMRGKVRDLPDSGVIYLNRIKPIGQEFKLDSSKSNSFKSSEVEKKPTAEAPKSNIPSSFEKYNSEEERAPIRQPAISFNVPTNTITPKMDEPKQSTQKSKLSIPEEAELDRILDELMTKDGSQTKLAGLPKIGRSTLPNKRHIGAYKPKVISFDGTARVETSSSLARSASKSPVSVRLMPRKLYSAGKTRKDEGADFDPWERMGQ